MNEEQWRPVEGYEGLYEVSNMGRVRSLDRSVSLLDTFKTIKGRVLRPSKSKDGYLKVVLCKEGKMAYKRVHRLVAEAFIPNPENKPFIDHINTIRTDNMVENLRWCTQKENCNNPISIERYKSNCKNTDKNKPVAKYTLEGELIAVYPSIREAARQNGCGMSHICSCCNGGNYQKGKWVNINKYKGFKWKLFNEEGES